MFIQTEATPNPATLKFLPGQIVLSEGTCHFSDLESAQISPLARTLFDVEGVSDVFFGNDFISITKSSGDWQHLKPIVLGVIMEHFVSGVPILFAGQTALDPGEEFFAPEDQETVDTIKELLDTRVRPAVAGDGGDITFRGFRDGVVFLSMKGACSGCPSSTATLKHGIQNLFRHFLPAVTSVEQI